MRWRIAPVFGNPLPRITAPNIFAGRQKLNRWLYETPRSPSPQSMRGPPPNPPNPMTNTNTTQEGQTPTPRTDKEAWHDLDGNECVYASFARTLETELAAQADYITFLESCFDECGPFLAAHNWAFSTKQIKEGNRLRAALNREGTK